MTRPQENFLLPLAFSDCPLSGLLHFFSHSFTLTGCLPCTHYTASVSASMDDEQEAFHTPTSNLQTLSWGRGTGKDPQWPWQMQNPRKAFDRESQRQRQSLWVLHNSLSQVIAVSRSCCHEPRDQGQAPPHPAQPIFNATCQLRPYQ